MARRSQPSDKKPAGKTAGEPAPAEQELNLGGFGQPPGDEGLSLERLTAAFQQMLSGGHVPYGPASDPEAPGGPPRLADEDAAREETTAPWSAGDDHCDVTPRSILEALLFVGHPLNLPLAAEKVAPLMRGVSAVEIEQLVRDLNERYRANQCPYEIRSEGAGYRLVLRDEYSRLRDRFFGRQRQARLSQAAVEVLSVVAYHQPVTAEEVNELRGRASGALLAQLVRRQLLSIERSSTPPRKASYSTTRRFLTLFGLESLDDLPRSVDLDRR